MKTSTQLKALVRNLSRQKNVGAEIILRNFMLERLLERISVSQYKNNFILKGGMLIAAMVGIDTRTTMDLDATLKGQQLTQSEIILIMENIINVPVDDGVIFCLRETAEIREEAEYSGYRISMEAALDKTRQIIKVDITTGDFITPREIEYNFKLMFEDRLIGVMAYNLETVLAEKFETVITRGLANTRMRDFYDIYILTATQPFDKEIFHQALKRTVAKRNMINQMSSPKSVIQVLATSNIMISQWERYQKNYNYASDVNWKMTISALNELAVKD